MKKISQLLVFYCIACGCQSYAQLLTGPQLVFLNSNVKTICTDETMSGAGWKYIAGGIKDKRMILLGEPNHGSKEIFRLRNDLIRFLHDELGFKTILFESGIGELAVADLNRAGMAPKQMTYGFFGGWRTKEFEELMEYVSVAQISIAGFDVQRTGGSFRSLLGAEAKKQHMDTCLYSNLEDRYGLIQRELTGRSALYDAVESKTAKLVSDYEHVDGLLALNNAVNASKEYLFTRRTISNRIRYLQYMLQYVKDGDMDKRWGARDSVMADNIKWLANVIYKNEKLIVVAHNYHIARYNQHEKVMGAMLVSQYDNDMYSLGIFAGSGSYSGNSGKEEKIRAADTMALDLKHIITRLPGFINYLHIPKKKNRATAWLHQSIVVNDTFIDLKGSGKMILSKQFDGLLFVAKISPPAE